MSDKLLQQFLEKCLPCALVLKKNHAMDTKKMQAEPLHGVEQDRELCVNVECVLPLLGAAI